MEYSLPQKTSSQPFPLQELIWFLDSVKHPQVEPERERFGFVQSFNETNQNCGADLEMLEDFTRLGSEFYPELGLHYTKAIDEWYQARAAELDAKCDD